MDYEILYGHLEKYGVLFTCLCFIHLLQSVHFCDILVRLYHIVVFAKPESGTVST